MPPCSSSIFSATNRTHPFIASIARADFSVCVRTSIRPLAPRRFMHPPGDSLSPPLEPSVPYTSLPILPTRRGYPSRDPTPSPRRPSPPLLRFSVSSIVDTTRLERLVEGRVEREADLADDAAIRRDRVRRLLDMPVDIPSRRTISLFKSSSFVEGTSRRRIFGANCRQVSITCRSMIQTKNQKALAFFRL